MLLDSDRTVQTVCPMCRSTTYQVFDRQVWRGYPLENLICSACGLVFQGGNSPARNPEFYASEYRKLYQGTENPTPKDLAIQTARAKKLVDFLDENSVGSIRRHLDIGASSGLFLDAVKKRFGTVPVGVEMGEAYRQHARGLGIQVYPDYDQMAGVEKEPFDLVSLIHTLEHFPDPLSYLVSLREANIQPDGYLLLEVPNLYAHDSFELGHLTNFSTHTLTQLVQQAGFEVVRSIRHGKPRSNLVPLYILLLARPVDTAKSGRPTIKPERSVQYKRRFGMLCRRFWERTLPGQAWLPIPKE